MLGQVIEINIVVLAILLFATAAAGIAFGFFIFKDLNDAKDKE